MQFTDAISSAIRGSKPRAFMSDGTNEVLFDVILSDVESDQLQVTRHAIEDGADVTDHVIDNPKDFSFEAVLTDDDIDPLDPNTFKNKKIDERLKIIQGWLDNKTILSYYGQDNDYSSVVISGIARNKAQGIGEGIRLSIGLAKITIAKSQVSEITVKTTTAKGKSAKGKDEKSKDVSEKDLKSWAKDIFGGLFG